MVAINTSNSDIDNENINEAIDVDANSINGDADANYRDVDRKNSDMDDNDVDGVFDECNNSSNDNNDNINGVNSHDSNYDDNGTIKHDVDGNNRACGNYINYEFFSNYTKKYRKHKQTIINNYSCNRSDVNIYGTDNNNYHCICRSINKFIIYGSNKHFKGK